MTSGDLPDVTGMPLADLLSDTDTALDEALRRLVRDRESGQNWTAFGNAPRGGDDDTP